MTQTQSRGSLYLDATRARALAALAGLSPAHWAFKPSPDRWSIAEVLEHVNVVHELILGPGAAQLDAAPIARNPDAALVDEIIMTRFTDRAAPRSSPEPALPASRWTPAESVERLERNCAALKHRLETAPGLRDHISDSRPLIAITNGQYKVMDGVEWILAAAAHMDRHVLQILEIKAAPGYPPA